MGPERQLEVAVMPDDEIISIPDGVASAETALRMAEAWGIPHTNLKLNMPGECMFDREMYVDYWRKNGYEVVEWLAIGEPGVTITRPDSQERIDELKAEYAAEKEAERYARSWRGRLARWRR